MEANALQMGNGNGMAAAVQQQEGMVENHTEVNVAGGNFGTANFGPVTHQYEMHREDKTVQNDYSGSHISNLNVTYKYVHNNVTSPTTEESPGEAAEGGQNWIDLKSIYRMYYNQKLGRRENVFCGERMSEVTGPKRVAIKTMPVCEIHIREAKSLVDLKHPNVVTVYHADCYLIGPMKQMFIAMELCSEVNLYDHIAELKQRGIPFDGRKYIRQSKELVEGLKFIHDQKIIHRDLKPHNILLSLCGNLLKIADFGLSKPMTSGRSVTAASISRVGTDGYRAPETYHTDAISQKADIFSLALILYYLWSYGLHPFGEDPDEWNINIKRYTGINLNGLRIEDKRNALHVLKNMIGREPTTRPTADWILCQAIFSPTQHNRSIHTSESAPTLFREDSMSQRPDFQHQQSQPQDPSRFQLELRSPAHNKFEDDFTDVKARSYSEMQHSRSSTPDKNRTRSNTSSPLLQPPLHRWTSISAENSPRNSKRHFVPRSEPPVRRQPQRSTARERPKPIIVPPNTGSGARPKSMPLDGIITDAFLQEPMQPQIVHNQKRIPVTYKSLLLFDKSASLVQLYNPAYSSWSKLREMPLRLASQNFTAIELDGYVYILSGDGQMSRFRYSSANSTWELMPNMRKVHGERPPAVVLNGCIYVVGTLGGTSPNSTDDVEVFSPSRQQWSDAQKMPNPRQHHAVVASGDSLYCIGGQIHSTLLKTVEKFNSSAKTWSDVPPMQQTRTYPAAAEYEGQIYVLGGYRANKICVDSKLSSAEVFDVSTNIWMTLTNMKKPRANFTACFLLDQIFAVGGEKKGFRDEKKTIESYDITMKKWIVTQVPKDIKMDCTSAVAVDM